MATQSSPNLTIAKITDADAEVTADSSARGTHESATEHYRKGRRRVRFAEISDSPAAMGVVGVAMVALVERSPLLATRAAWAMLEDSCASRWSAHRGRDRRLLTRRRDH